MGCSCLVYVGDVSDEAGDVDMRLMMLKSHDVGDEAGDVHEWVMRQVMCMMWVTTREIILPLKIFLHTQKKKIFAHTKKKMLG